MTKRTLIIGAGEAGAMVARAILDNDKLNRKYSLTGFLDDDSRKSSLLGYPVWHDIRTLADLGQKLKLDTVIIAIPSASSEQMNRILDNILGLDVQIKIVPGISEIIEGDVNWRQIREFRPEDLLGREEIAFEKERLQPCYEGHNILVSGGGGSIGSEICRQLLQLPVNSVIALGHGENSLYRLEQEFPGETRLQLELCDVQNRDKLDHIISKHGIQDIFHAAAHKHVPLMEQFPEEALRNNVLGTLNMAESAVANEVSNFLFISTDKAVNPTSVMGASKRLAEKVILSFTGTKTRFHITRFGNVLGSRGSVIPLFLQQIRQGGPVTVTNREIERYFMSIREAARLVLKANTVEDGSIIVLDMGKPVKIFDLARNMIRLAGYNEEEIPLQITGIRPGEKMYEELLSDQEKMSATSYSKLFIANDSSSALPDPDKLQGQIRELLNTVNPADIRRFLFTMAE